MTDLLGVPAFAVLAGWAVTHASCRSKPLIESHVGALCCPLVK